MRQAVLGAAAKTAAGGANDTCVGAGAGLRCTANVSPAISGAKSIVGMTMATGFWIMSA